KWKQKNSVVYDIMSFKNQHLFYLMNNTPTKITIWNINVNNKNDEENLLN
ncbi:4425_t:CDS:1, partial [Gigaspora rosea]